MMDAVSIGLASIQYYTAKLRAAESEIVMLRKKIDEMSGQIERLRKQISQLKRLADSIQLPAAA